MHKSDANARLKFRKEPPKSGLVFWPWVLTYFKKIENDVLFSNDTGIFGGGGGGGVGDPGHLHNNVYKFPPPGNNISPQNATIVPPPGDSSF